jgi:hypothetical protein
MACSAKESATRELRSVQLVLVGRERRHAKCSRQEYPAEHSPFFRIMTSDPELQLPLNDVVPIPPKKRGILSKFKILALTVTALQRWRSKLFSSTACVLVEN